MTQKNAAQHYLEQQIVNASPAERIVLLYNGAIKFLMKARQAIDENNIQERYNNNKRAGDIIVYLLETLDMEKGGEISFNLSRIYHYMLRRLVDVDMKNDQAAIDDVLKNLRTLKASWEQIANGAVSDDLRAQSAPVQAEHAEKKDTDVTQEAPDAKARRSAIA